MTFPPIDALPGVEVRRPPRHQDARGLLMEVFRDDEEGATHRPAMAYVSVTLPGQARGPHEHVHQSDFFAFAGPGEFLLVMWDHRPGSPTRGRRMCVRAGESAPATVRVPPGVVHAYRCVSAVPGWVLNLPDRLYRGPGRAEAVDEIRHEDDPGSPFTRDFAGC